MISGSKDIRIVTLSVKVYRALLVAYPTRFVREYDVKMLLVFQDCCRHAVLRGGTAGFIRFWAVTLIDLVQSVISEHRQKEIQMKTQMAAEDIQLAGKALIWAAVALILGISVLTVGGSKLWGLSTLLITFIGMPLCVAGLLGLRKRYGEKIGGVGRSMLTSGVVLGPLSTFLGFFGISYGNQFLQVLFISGPGILFAFLALFGVVALITRPLPRWNAVPLLAGIWYPLLTAAYIVTSLRTGNWEESTASGSETSILLYASFFLLVLQGLALAGLGHVLKSDAPATAPA